VRRGAPHNSTLELIREYLRHINWKALFVAFFAFYGLPALLSMVLASWILSIYGQGPFEEGFPLSLAVGLLWWWVMAPVGSGYLAARLSGRLPLLHALITVIVGYLFQISKITDAVWWLLPAWAVISLAGGFFGAFVWQLHQPRQP
jgi:hypothetical protein